MDIFFEIHKNLPRESPGNNEATRKAYSFLKNSPPKPHILDIGCGPGMQTIELAKLSEGKIFALDNHPPFLKDLMRRAKMEGMLNRIEIINCSMFNMNFEENSFDIIWSEGAIYIYGFKQGLKDWRFFLKDNGYFVVSEISWIKENPPQELKEFWNKAYPNMKTIKENLQVTRNLGYRMNEHFILLDSGWWEYYGPLENRIFLLKEKYEGNEEAMQTLEEELEEIKIYRKYSEWYGNVYYIMQK